MLKTNGTVQGCGIYSIAGIDVSNKTRAEILDVAKNAAKNGQAFDFVLAYKRGETPQGAVISN